MESEAVEALTHKNAPSTHMLSGQRSTQASHRGVCCAMTKPETLLLESALGAGAKRRGADNDEGGNTLCRK